MDSLSKYRKDIDQIDKKILKLLKKRIIVVEKIGKIKKINGKEVKDPSREKAKINTLIIEARALGINEEVIKNVWHALFKISYKIEK
ncbi:chorismate mutase [Candidatus Daviesbacteria bacterium]|nr:chorismate mutase [Candidatus Daviesbacteria bacterium]